MICSKCKRTIIKYPCSHCGYDGDTVIDKFSKKGGSGGPQPSDD